MKTILYFQFCHSEINRRAWAGALACAKKKGVRLQLIEVWRQIGEKPVSGHSYKKEFLELIDFWQPVSIIVEGGRMGLDAASFTDGRTPTVYLGCPRFKPQGDVFITTDNRAIADAAARELLTRPLSALAFVGAPEKTDWSLKRQKRLSELAKLNGYTLQVHDKPKFSAKGDPKLEAWLKELPKPCGVFAANDFIARHVIACCHLQDLTVPDEVSVVGADNEELICQSAETTISSVQSDFFAAGRLAVESACRLSSAATASVKDGVFGVSSVVRRQSSRPFARHDERVIGAVEYIRAHGLHVIHVSDVVRSMGGSRRLAEMRFREVTGHSILDEIRSVRITKAMELLHDPEAHVAEVAYACGYANTSALRKAFLKVSGEPLADWRRRVLASLADVNKEK